MDGRSTLGDKCESSETTCHSGDELMFFTQISRTTAKVRGYGGS
jgi:hypothetical protein